jgi:hypothetical protein
MNELSLTQAHAPKDISRDHGNDSFFRVLKPKIVLVVTYKESVEDT